MNGDGWDDEPSSGRPGVSAARFLKIWLVSVGFTSLLGYTVATVVVRAAGTPPLATGVGATAAGLVAVNIALFIYT